MKYRKDMVSLTGTISVTGCGTIFVIEREDRKRVSKLNAHFGVRGLCAEQFD